MRSSSSGVLLERIRGWGGEKGKLLLSTHIVHVPYLSWDIPGSGWISAEIRLRDDSCAATKTA